MSEKQDEDGVIVGAAELIGKTAGRVANIVGLSSPAKTPHEAHPPASKTKLPKKSKSRLPRRQKKAQKKVRSAASQI
jgi:hypothetical protein